MIKYKLEIWNKCEAVILCDTYSDAAKETT